MDYGKAVSFVFNDKNWIGVILVGGALGLVGLLFFWTLIIPILAIAALLGYMMQLIRDVRLNPDAGLPAWTDWGKKLSDGLKLMIVSLIWAIPLFLLIMPIIFFIVLAAAYSDSNALSLIAAIVSLAAGMLATLYGLLLVFLQPAFTINLAVRDEFSAGLDVGAIFKITRAHFVDILIILILIWGISYIASYVGILIFLIGVFFTSFWVMLVRGHLFGQLARLALPVEKPEDVQAIVPTETQSISVTE